MGKKVISVITLIFLFFMVSLLISSSKGKMGYSKRGCICHGKFDRGSAEIKLLTSPDIFKEGFIPDSTYKITCSLMGNKKMRAGGFNLQVSHGKLVKSDRSTITTGSEATHSNNQKKQWVLNWIAPEGKIDTVKFCFTGCLVNQDYGRTGDEPTKPQSLITQRLKVNLKKN